VRRVLLDRVETRRVRPRTRNPVPVFQRIVGRSGSTVVPRSIRRVFAAIPENGGYRSPRWRDSPRFQ
jgi:hypothetical protein